MPYGKLCPKAMRHSTCGELKKCTKVSHFHLDLCMGWIKSDDVWKPLWGWRSWRHLVKLVIVPGLWAAEEEPTGSGVG